MAKRASWIRLDMLADARVEVIVLSVCQFPPWCNGSAFNIVEEYETRNCIGI